MLTVSPVREVRHHRFGSADRSGAVPSDVDPQEGGSPLQLCLRSTDAGFDTWPAAKDTFRAELIAAYDADIDTVSPFLASARARSSSSASPFVPRHLPVEVVG